MTNAMAAAFLADIIANPADDALRLIYADWLEEQGEGARAEFVRVQIELEATPFYDREPCHICGHEPDDAGWINHSRGCHTQSEDGGGESVADRNPDYERLKNRARELLEANRVRWLADAPCPMDAWSLDEPMIDWAYGVRCQFRRGFVASVTLSAADWLLHGPALVRAAPLEEVRLSDREPRAPDANHPGFSWWRLHPPQNEPDDLREEFWDKLPLPHHLYGSAWKGYESRSSALAALSDASILWAKSAPPPCDKS